MVRGFFSSGIIFSKSIRRSPSIKEAPDTFTFSARVKDLEKARFDTPL
jgi:hypothetical protein